MVQTLQMQTKESELVMCYYSNYYAGSIPRRRSNLTVCVVYTRL